ncbi:MAG: hypothetical protein KAJ19_03375 [Gammaproteobacteria bacterium]|nr:hypothetical protein [Gammaproteobacteria bacterium]
MRYVLPLIGLLLFFIGSLPVIRHLVHQSREKRQLAQLQYQQLKQRVTRLRLSHMLTFLGADLDEYLDKVPREEIEKHIHNCKECKALQTCDDCLGNGRPVSDMNFCPNYRSLTLHSKTLADHQH